MLKGRSKSFAPKSAPRAPPRRKAQDDAPEPAKQVSVTPDQPAKSTPDIPRVEKRRAQESIEEPPAKRVSTVSDHPEPLLEITRVERRQAQEDVEEPPAEQASIVPNRPAEATPEIARVEKRRGPETIEEPPAKRATFISDQTPIPVPQILQSELPTSASNNIVTAHEAAPAPETNITPVARSINPELIDRQPRNGSLREEARNSAAPGRESVSSTSIVPELESAARDTPKSSIGAGVDADTQVSLPSINDGRADSAPSMISNVEAPPVPSITSQTNAAKDSVLQSIERSETPTAIQDERVASPPPAAAHPTSPAASTFRYPSPENIARLVDSEPLGTPANMGPPGGQLGAAGDTTAIMRSGEIVQMATLNPDGTTGGIVIEEPPSGAEKGKKKKKVVKKKKVLTGEATPDGTRATIDMALKKARRQENKRPKKKDKEKEKEQDGAPGKKRRAREETPPDAEEETIDITTLTMQELCQDLRIGKKFSRHDEIKQRILKKQQEATRNKMRTQDQDVAARLDLEDEEDEARFARNAAAARLAAAASGASPDTPPEEVAEPDPVQNASAQGVRYLEIDGQIVVDQQSTVVDLQKQAAREREELQAVEENDFSRVFTSGTYMKREKNSSWDPVATDEFYKYLGQYGTDFTTIAKLFPGRSRRQIKLKFNTEEKKNAAKVTRYLTNPKAAMDFEAFERNSGCKLETVEAIEEEIARAVAVEEAKFQAQQEGLAAADRAKKAKINETRLKRLNGKDGAGRILDSVEMGSDGEEDAPRRSAGESSKENAAPTTGKGKKKAAVPKKARKNKHSHNAGGDEVIVLGSIE